jgi:hypothetical protein
MDISSFTLSGNFKGVSPLFVQVLVVRKNKQNGDAEFEVYKNQLSDDYVILKLPDYLDLSHTSVGKRVYVSEGIGYARLFSQLIEHDLQLEHIWMIDDNVKACLTFDLARVRESHLFTHSAPRESDEAFLGDASAIAHLQMLLCP